jgi:hypothetical protein
MLAGMASSYGRPWERRKKAALFPGVRCWICGEPIRWRAEGTLDHVIPVAEGGANGPVRPAHRTCNMRRNAERTTAIRRSRPETTKRQVRQGAIKLDADDRASF